MGMFIFTTPLFASVASIATNGIKAGMNFLSFIPSASLLCKEPQMGQNKVDLGERGYVGTLLPLMIASVVVGGCAINAYVDPTLPKVSYSDIAPKMDRGALYLSVEFLTHGKPNPKATEHIFAKIKKVLLASQLYSTVSSVRETSMDSLMVVMNNIGDTAKAGGEGAVTGLTLGLAGSLVTDEYLFSATYVPFSKEPVKREYRHAIHTTIGVREGPPGLQPMSLDDAVDKLVEDLVLSLLRDLRKGEVL
jgi:hypothetical protein